MPSEKKELFNLSTETVFEKADLVFFGNNE